jgi:hypothetical protein
MNRYKENEYKHLYNKQIARIQPCNKTKLLRRYAERGLESSKTVDGVEYLPEWHICDFATYGIYTNYYVRDVSARNTP